MTSADSFGHWVQQRRKALDLTQTAMALTVGCSVSAIRKIETNQRRPSRMVAERLADVLMLTAEERRAFLQAARQLPGATRPIPPSNLAIPQTAFVGRAQERDMVRALLEHPDVRLLTLTGTGGVGKTRLALHAAHEMQEHFPQGVWFVSLAELHDAAFVLPSIARILGIRENRFHPLLDEIQQQLRHQQLLLVLDNFEHVREAAPMVVSLLAAAPRLKLLVTSRVALQQQAEHEVVVSPLPVPPLQRLPSVPVVAQYDAVALFIARARAVEPNFCITHENLAAISELCVRLDGLPLAIELVVARLRLFPPAALLPRLTRCLQLLTGGNRAQHPRQHTLRATLEWSYDLLERDAQIVFARLSVFAGSFLIEAVESLCPPTAEPAIDVLNALTTLLDHHLIQQEAEADGTMRFRLLETVRSYALERLVSKGEVHTTWRHLAWYYIMLVGTMRKDRRAAQQKAWLNRLEHEHNTIRALLHWALENDEAEVAVELSGQMWTSWNQAGMFTEARRWLEAALAHPQQDLACALARSRAYGGAGVFAQLQGDFAQAIAYHEQSVALLAEVSDPYSTAHALNRLGTGWYNQGAYARATDCFEQSLAIFRDLGDIASSALVTENLGNIAERQGAYDQALALYQESLAGALQVGDATAEASLHLNLGILFIDQKDLEQARTNLEHSLTLFQGVGIMRGVTLVLVQLGRLFLIEGNTAEARRCCKESLPSLREQGDPFNLSECCYILATIAAQNGEIGQAARLVGAGRRFKEIVPPAFTLRGQAIYIPIINAAHSQLDEASWHVAWNEGYTMTADAAVTYALHCS